VIGAWLLTYPDFPRRLKQHSNSKDNLGGANFDTPYVRHEFAFRGLTDVNRFDCPPFAKREYLCAVCDTVAKVNNPKIARREARG
jgi:hypothetical protein